MKAPRNGLKLGLELGLKLNPEPHLPNPDPDPNPNPNPNFDPKPHLEGLQDGAIASASAQIPI